jgi:hypothetical protein
VTVNDLLLAAITVRELLVGRGDDVSRLVLRTSVPVGAGPPVSRVACCPSADPSCCSAWPPSTRRPPG